jgi:hypothetical protein
MLRKLSKEEFMKMFTNQRKPKKEKTASRNPYKYEESHYLFYQNRRHGTW